MIPLIMLAAGWAVYFVLHSLLASLRTKHWIERRWPALHRYYRLVYNVIALAALVPVLVLLARSSNGVLLLPRPPSVAILANVLALAAVAGFVWTLRYYDGRAFLGLRSEGSGQFTLSPLHRHVRHPWYFLALIVIWTRPLDAAWLVSALAITGYLIIGSRLEDTKLLAEFGEPYRRYRQQVPGLMPWPGRTLPLTETPHTGSDR